MADPRGFLKFKRETQKRRPVELRLHDWHEVYEPITASDVRNQAGRCMDCGIPFCHHGCPLGNLIPEWNDLGWRDKWHEASERLHATNNFPEFTGRLCPAPCEAACVLGIGDEPVTIELVEKEIAERAWSEGWVTPILPSRRSAKRVAIVGSGPAGLAAAQQLTRAGHEVVVFERADAIGGLLRYGIPEFKMEKSVLDRRLEQMQAEGTQFKTGVDVGVALSVSELRDTFDATLITIGSTVGRSLSVEGSSANGIYQAMDFLPPANRFAGGLPHQDLIDVHGKKVVIIGGGDTGADCLGTAHRQGAATIVQLEIMPMPPTSRADQTPWPTWPLIYRTSSAHEEGGDRVFAINTEKFLTDTSGKLTGLATHRVELVQTERGVSFEKVPGSDAVIEADVVLLAMGFTGPERGPLLDGLGVKLNSRGTIDTDDNWMTSTEGIFAAGDGRRGQSLIVWAIAEGRSAAASVDRYLVGESELPSPVEPNSKSMTA